MDKTTKYIIWLVVLVIVIWGGYALLNKPKPASGEVIRIGAIFPLTGPNASYGESAQRGIKLALEKINGEGGISGRNLEVVFEDSQFQSVPALNVYQKFIASGIKIFMTIGSQVGTTIGTKAREDGNLNYELTAVTPKYRDGSPLTCRSALTADVSSQALTKYFEKNNIKKIATFTTKDEQGVAVEETLAQSLASFGGQIIAKENYQLQDIDFRTQVTKIKAANPDVLVVIAPGQHAEAVFKQLRELKFNKPILSNNWTIKNQDFKSLLLAEGVIFSDYAFESSEQFPAVVTANAYDAVMILAEAIREVGGLPEKVAEYITKIKNYKGIAGELSFDKDCEAGQEIVLRIVKTGQFVRVE